MNKQQQILIEHDQQHVAALLDSLQGEQRRRLAEQVSQIDWDTVELWRHPQDLSGSGNIQPIAGLTLPEIQRDRTVYRKAGEQALRQGKVGAVLLAGGQGTRLGSDAPKGAYDMGLTRPLYIFQLLIGNLLEVCNGCGCYVPLFVMTSESNDGYTREFLRRHDYFGYPQDQIRFFVQDMFPVTDLNGKLLVRDGQLVTSPNGNGGWFSSLTRSGVLKDFPDIEWLNAFAVDNVLQRIADPVFVGATILSGVNCGAKFVRKCDPHERVGALCLQNGVSSVIEYYEMTEQMANQTDPDGELTYGFGVILNYLFRLSKLQETAGKRMPVHVVKKKVPVEGEDGTISAPDKENAYKFETLILDMVKLMQTCLPFEVVREREFAPVKNREGTDSVESARKLLRQNGVQL